MALIEDGIGSVILHHWATVILCIAGLLWALYNLWRKYKDKIKKALGAKSKTLRDKLVGKMRKLKWRPIRIPMPQPV